MDGGIVVPPGGDGIQRVPTDPAGVPIDPYMPADDRAKASLGLEPSAPSVTPTKPTNGAGSAASDTPNPSGDKEPVESEFDKSLTVKGKKK